jgi:hypothetical protein
MWRRRKQSERDLERELRSHPDLEAEERREAGLLPDQVRYAAQRAFGNTTLIQDATRERWGWIFLDRLQQDVRYALRGMRKNSGFALAVMVTLALSIGANAAFFSIVNALLRKDLPYVHPERMGTIFARTTGSESSDLEER